jgi:cytochrome c
MKMILQILVLALCTVGVAPADEVISNAKANRLMTKYSCQTCHTVTGGSLSGPSFTAVAKKYASDPQAVGDLSASILNGSSGTWGDSSMPSNDVPSKDLKALVVWILQLM